MDDEEVAVLVRMIERYSVGQLLVAMAEVCHERADDLLTIGNKRADKWYHNARVIEKCTNELFDL